MNNLWIIYRESMDLVGGIPAPLKNMSSTIGMMTFPIDGKNICSKLPTSFGW